jgi:hypothetical protein
MIYPDLSYGHTVQRRTCPLLLQTRFSESFHQTCLPSVITYFGRLTPLPLLISCPITGSEKESAHFRLSNGRLPQR